MKACPPDPWGCITSRGYRFRGRVYVADVLAGHTPEPHQNACREIKKILRDHGRAMSFSLIRSRTVPLMPAPLLASCLVHMIQEDMGVGMDEWDLFEADS